MFINVRRPMSIVKYTCANQIEAQKLFTTAQIYAVCPIHALDHTDHQVIYIDWPHRSYTTTIQSNTSYHTMLQRAVHPGPEQYRVQIPASAFTTVSSPSEALSLLLAWLLPCCWRQTVAQPIRTSHLQTIRFLLATPHLQCGNASTLNK